MFIFSVLLFFALVCAGAWLLLFPAGRELVAQSVALLRLRVGRGVRRANHGGLRQAAAAGRVTRSGLRRGWRWLCRRSLLALAAAVVLTVPALLAWLVSNPGMLGGYDDDAGHAINTQVADLLKGEQLAPPTPLPPVVFATTEVAQVRPMLGGANRNWALLEHDFAQRLLLVFKIMKDEHGYDMAILEGYRSPERQNLLAAAGPSVTNAKAFQSYHQFGLAADCAFLRDGKLLISEKDPWAMRGYRLYGQVAESARRPALGRALDHDGSGPYGIAGRRRHQKIRRGGGPTFVSAQEIPSLLMAPLTGSPALAGPVQQAATP